MMAMTTGGGRREQGGTIHGADGLVVTLLHLVLVLAGAAVVAACGSANSMGKEDIGKQYAHLTPDQVEEQPAHAPQVAGLKARGVDFRVCRNTLKGRNLTDEAVIMEAKVVPSGVAEIGKLQAKEGYVYLKP